MATKTVNLNTATIGPSTWRSNTLKEIKLSQSVVNRSDRSCETGRAVDPLPHLRETVGELSNEEAHKYFRNTRQVVCLLRESLLDTNEEIKSLTRGKEALEKALEHIRKDLRLNQESMSIRESRPAREKDHDGADDLLGAERMHLLNLKKMLEAQLQLVQQQLQVLDSARRRLAAVVQERSRVLDLICSALPSTNTSSSTSVLNTRNYGNYSYSNTGRYSRMSNTDGMGSPTVDPLGPFTPEAEQALVEAREARARSGQLRKELADSINRSDNMQKVAHKSVNNGLTQKIAETVSLKQHLQVASGENRHSLHRSQRWYDATEKAWGYTRGPVSSTDLSTREKLNRPVISMYQRHPGTNLPEAQEIVKGGDGLLNSLTETSRNIGLLNLAQLRLKDDIRDKATASSVDGSIVRLRRRKANHRWAMGAAF